MNLKLNNHGWGLQAMMVGVLVIMIALVVIAALAQKTFGDLNNNNGSKNDSITYNDLEQKVITAAKKYQSTYYNDMLDGEKITVTIETLKEKNLISNLVINKISCSGYAVFKMKNNSITYNSYIKCGDNYKTEGYNASLDS